ncbi:Mitochondrial DNA mismatch repair protein mutS [Trichinella spiralis]|uniref:Mitochondrial DNA mismatch repair protein mutS n=1 Tax=Trichinella spiralis TaxID=6334 RepID=A0ABR3K2D4_TRISP
MLKCVDTGFGNDEFHFPTEGVVDGTVYSRNEKMMMSTDQSESFHCESELSSLIKLFKISKSGSGSLIGKSKPVHSLTTHLTTASNNISQPAVCFTLIIAIVETHFFTPSPGV